MFLGRCCRQKLLTCVVCEWFYGCDSSVCKPREHSITGEILDHGACKNPNPAAEANCNIPPCRSRSLHTVKAASEKRNKHFESDWHATALAAACEHESVKKEIEDAQDIYGTRGLGKRQREVSAKLRETLSQFPAPTAASEETEEECCKQQCQEILPITDPTILKCELEKNADPPRRNAPFTNLKHRAIILSRSPVTVIQQVVAQNQLACKTYDIAIE